MNSDLTSDNAQGLDDSGTSPEILDSTVSRIWYSVSSVPGLFWNVLCWQLNPLIKLYYVIVTSLDGSRGKQRKLLCWLEAMSGREVRDLQAVWDDGSIVCDIINAVMVGNCEPKDHHGNCLRHAQELASHHFKLLPVFSNSELQKPFNPSFEKRLWRYLLALRNALKHRLTNNMADQDEKDPEYLIAEEYVARGMGLILASQGERAIFFIYSRDDSSLADIHIHIKGPNGDCGEATAGEPIDSEHHSIAIDYRLTPDYLKVCYIPNSLGRHELSLTRYGFNIPGSPFIIKVGEHTGPPAEKFSYLDWLTEEQEEEQRLEIERKRKLKVVSRVIDFINEKMHMTEDGQLVKIEDSSLKVPSPAPYTLKRTGRSVSPRPRCKLSSQKRSKSLTNQKLIQAAEFLKFSKEEKKCVQDAASQVSEDFSMIHPVGIDQFQEKCQRIVRACDFLLSHAPKQKSLEILSTAEKILDIPYNNTLTHHKSSFELYKPDIDNFTPDINIQNLTTESSRSSETDDEKEVIKPCTPEINVTRVDFSDRLYSMRRFDDVGLNAVSGFSTSSSANGNISTPQVNWEKDRSKSTSPQKDARMARKSFQTVGYTKAKRSSQTSLPTNNISDEILLSDNKNDNLEESSTDNIGDEMCLGDNENVNIEENSTNNKGDGICVSDFRGDYTEGNKENQHNYIGEDENLHNVTVLETDCSGKNAQEEINFEHSSTRLSRSREPKITRNSKQAKTVSNLVKQFENHPVCSSVLSGGNELTSNVETFSGEDNIVKPSIENDDSNTSDCVMMGESLITEINNGKLEIRPRELDDELNEKTDETKENVPKAEICEPVQSIMSGEIKNKLSQNTCNKVDETIESGTSEQNVIIDDQNTANDEQNVIPHVQTIGVEEMDEKTNDSGMNISDGTIISEREENEDTNAQGRQNNSIQDIESHSEIIENKDESRSTLQGTKDEHEALVDKTPELDVEKGIEEDNTERKSLEGSCFKEDIQLASSIKSRISAFEEYSRKSEKDSLSNKTSKKGESVSRFGKIVTSTGDGMIEGNNGRESTVKIDSKQLENIESPNELPLVMNIINKTEEDIMETVNKEQSNNIEELSNSNYVEEVENKNEDAKDSEDVKYSEINQENSNAYKQVEDLVECSDEKLEAEIDCEAELTLKNSVQNVMEESSPTLHASNEECVLLSMKHVSFDGESSTKDVEKPAFENLKHSEIDETALSDEDTSLKENEIVILLEDEKLVENNELNHSEKSVEPEQVSKPDNVVNRDDILVCNTDQENKDISRPIVIEPLLAPSSSEPDCTTEKESTAFKNETDNVRDDNMNHSNEEDSKLCDNIDYVDSEHPVLTKQITATPPDADIVKLIEGEAEEYYTPPEDKTEKKEHKEAEVLETSKIDSNRPTDMDKNRRDFIDVKEEPIIVDEVMNVSSCDIETVDQFNNLSTRENEVITRNELIDANVVPEIISEGDDVEESSNNQIKTDESVVSLSEIVAMEDNENISSASLEIITNTIGIVTATLGIVTNENQKSHISIEEKLEHGNENLSVNIPGVELETSLRNSCEASNVDGNLKTEASLECNNTIISRNSECNVNSTIDEKEIIVERESDDNEIDRKADNEPRAIESKDDDDVVNDGIDVKNDDFDSQNIEIYENKNEKNIELNPDLTSNMDISEDIDHALITDTANFKQQEIISSESDALNDSLNQNIINNDKIDLENTVIIKNKVDDSDKTLEDDNTVEDIILSGEKILSDSNMDNNSVENLNKSEKNNDSSVEDVERSIGVSVTDEQNTSVLSINIVYETEEEEKSVTIIPEENKINSSHGIENNKLTDVDRPEVNDHVMVVTPEKIPTNLDNLKSDEGQILDETIAGENNLEDDKLPIHSLETVEVDKNECLIGGNAAGEKSVSEKTQNNDALLDNVTSIVAEMNIEKNIEQISEMILDVAHDITTKSAEVEKGDSFKTNAEEFSKNSSVDDPVEKELLLPDDTKIKDSNHGEIILGDHDEANLFDRKEKAEINTTKVVESLISVNKEDQSISESSALEAINGNEGSISENLEQFEKPLIVVTAGEDVIVENIPTVIQRSETSNFDKEIPESALDEQEGNQFEAENRSEDLIDGNKTLEISAANEEKNCSNHEESYILDQFISNKSEEEEKLLEEGKNIEGRTSDTEFKVDEEKPESEDDRNKKNNETGITEISDKYLAKENCEFEEIASVHQRAPIIDEETIEREFSNHSSIVKEEIPCHENSLHLKEDTIIESCEDSSSKQSCATKNDKLLEISGADGKILLEKLDQSSESTVPSSATDSYLLGENISDISEATVLTEDHVAQTIIEFDTDNTGTKDKMIFDPDLISSQITIERDNNNDTTESINLAECSSENKKSSEIEDGSHMVKNEIEINQNFENNADILIESNELLVVSGMSENELFQQDHNSELEVPSNEVSEEAGDKEFIEENEKIIEPVGDDNKILRDENDESPMEADSESYILNKGIIKEESENSYLVMDEVKDEVEDALERKEMTEESISENVLGVLETSGNDKGDENMEEINCQKNLDELAENLCNISAKMKVEQELQDINNDEDKIGYGIKLVEENIRGPPGVDCESMNTENCIQQNEIENKIEITDDLSLVINNNNNSSTLEDDGGSLGDILEKITDSVAVEHVNVIEISCDIQKSNNKLQTDSEVTDALAEKGFQDNLEVGLESCQLNKVDITLNQTKVEQNKLENTLKNDIGSNLEPSRDEKSVEENSEVNKYGNSEVEMEDNINFDNLDNNVNSNLQNINIYNNQLQVETEPEAVSELEMNVDDLLVDKKSNFENCSKDDRENLKISSENLEESSRITIVNDGEENDEKLVKDLGSELSIPPILIVDVKDESNVSDKSTQMININEKIEENEKISILSRENIEDTKTKKGNMENDLNSIPSEAQSSSLEEDIKILDSLSCNKLDKKLEVEDIAFEGGEDMNQKQFNVDETCIDEETPDNVNGTDHRLISCEDNLGKELISEALIAKLETDDNLIKTESSSSDLLEELSSELGNGPSQVLLDSEIEIIEASVDLSGGTPDSTNIQEYPFDIPGDSQHVDVEKQIEVDKEGILINSPTISNENTISEEVLSETSRGNEEENLKYELSDNNSKEDIISDVSIPTTGEKIGIFNDKESKENEMDYSNQPLLTIDVENISSDSQNIIQNKLKEDIDNCQIDSLSEVGLNLKNYIQELKTAEDVIFSDETISLVENYELIESSQPNEGLFDKELVDDLDLSLDEVNTHYNDTIIDEKQSETGTNKLDYHTGIFEKSEGGFITPETIQNKSIEQVLPAEEKIVESIISDQTAMDNVLNIEQTASAGIEIVLSTSKDENSTNLKICGDESVVLEKQMQNEDSKEMFCDKILENNTSINLDEVVPSDDIVNTNLEVIDGNEAVIFKEEVEDSTTLLCNVPVIDITSVDSTIATVTNELTDNFEYENQQDNSSEKDSCHNNDADLLPNNESFIDSITEENKYQLEIFKKQLEKNEMNTNMTEEGLERVENNEKIKEEFKNEDGKEINTNMEEEEEELKTMKSKDKSNQEEFGNEEISRNEDLEIIDIGNDDSIIVHEKPAAHEAIVESSLKVEGIQNESPSSFQLSELSLGRQETFLLVNSPKKDSSSCNKAEKPGVKGLIEKFSSEIPTTSEEKETILESGIVQCEPHREKETLGVHHEGDGSQPDRNNKLSKLIQRFETNIVDGIQENALTANEKLVTLDDHVEKNKIIEIIEKKISEDKETIDNTIFKDFEFEPTSIPTILADIIPDETNEKDEKFPSQHEFDLCSIGSHDDDVVSKSYTDINDDSNESLTKNENFGSTEHLLLCVEGMEDGEIKQTVTDEGQNNQNKSMNTGNNKNNYDKIISENGEALIHEDQSSFDELTENKNHEIDRNKIRIDSMEMKKSGEVIKRYGTSNDLLADLVIEENLLKNETEVGDKSLVSFIEIEDSMNLNKEELVSDGSESVVKNSVEENSQHETLCIISENTGEISGQNICVMQDDSLIIIEEQADLSLVDSQKTGIGREVPTEVTLTPPRSVESHHTENESEMNGTNEIPAEPRDVCYEILNEISTEKSKTEEDSLLKTSISDKQGTDSTGSELNRSISLIVNSSLESDFNLHDDGAQISECVLEVLMSNNENLESVEEPERDSIEDVLSTEAGEACVELEEKQVTEELAWLDKKSNELEEPASLSSFNLWPSNSVIGPSNNEPNPTSELSEDIDFDSIISAPSLDEALKKFEKRLSDKMSKEKTSSIEETNETRGEGEKVENNAECNEIIMEPETLIKYCVPCDDTTSYLSLSINQFSRPSSRMEIIREEAEEMNDNQEVEEGKKIKEEGQNLFLDSDDVSVSDISECLEKFDSLIQETELRDKDLLEIDDNKLIHISVTDCDSEENTDNLLQVESEIPECDRMIMNESVNTGDTDSEHQLSHDLQVNENDNLYNVPRNEKIVYEVHDIVHFNESPHDKRTTANFEDNSTLNDCQRNFKGDEIVSSSILREEMESTGVSNDKKKERKPRKSLVKTKKMFWDEKLKNLQAEQENKNKMLIEKRNKTGLKDHSNKRVVAQPTSKINKNVTKQCNQGKLTETKNENLVNVEKTDKIIPKNKLNSHNDTSSNRDLIVEEPIKIVIELSDEKNGNIEDRKSVDNWKNYWNNLLVNEKDEELQTTRRQPSIRIQGIVASSRNLFEKQNSNLERSVSCEILSNKSGLVDENRVPARSVGENLNKVGLEASFKSREGQKSERNEEKNNEILQKSESVSNISERIKFFERSSIASNTDAKCDNNIEITKNLKNNKKSSIENTNTPCSPTTIKIDYFDDNQESLPHQTMGNRKMRSESIDSSDGDMYNPLTMTLSGRVRSFSTGKIEETSDGSLSNIEEDRSAKGSDQCLEKKEEGFKKTDMLDTGTSPLSRAKSEGNLSINEKITSRARFEQAKSFFKCLEKENLGEKKVRDDCLILNKPGRLKQVSMDSDSCGEGCKPKKKESKYRRRGRRRRKDSSTMKVRSAPTSDSECRMSMYDSEFGGSERHKRIAERFHVKHLFRDISGDTDGIFKGIPNRKAVLASLEDLRADSVPDEQQDNDEPTRSQSLSSIPSGYQDEYPYLPTTPPSQYRHRSQLEDRLISRCCRWGLSDRDRMETQSEKPLSAKPHSPPMGEEDMMEVGDGSEEADEEEEEEEAEQPSIIMTLATSNTMPYEGLASPLRLSHAGGGKPLNLKRGKGRPRKDASSHYLARQKKPLGLKLKRSKSGVYVPSEKSPRHTDGDDMMSSNDGLTSPLDSARDSFGDEKEKIIPPYSPPLFQEQWPGKVCALCNLSERSQLGQGELMRLSCPEGFRPQRSDPQLALPPEPPPPDEPAPAPDKPPAAAASATTAVTYRRQKSLAKCRLQVNGQEHLDELTVVGYAEEPDLSLIFEREGYFYVHESCAVWSCGVSRPTDLDLQNSGGPIVVRASSRRCSHCGRFGASAACTFAAGGTAACQRLFHLPCAAASGAFQDTKSYSLICNLHLDQVPLLPNLGDVTCMSCFSLGDVSNLMMCSMCGNHYHGACVGLALLPGVRAGWQCADCRVCQLCRQPEDSKVMLCETCEKAYHPHCLRPVVTSIPKYGWKCKCCRLCSDCGSRTPGAGQSSRWHAHYTVCDSCYQQRNKGFSCPLCHRAYRAAAYREMVQCSSCKKFVHGTCDAEADLPTYQQRKETNPEYEYFCPICKNERQHVIKRKDSTEELAMDSNLSASQESLVMDEYDYDPSNDKESQAVGLGKGKPFLSSKIAKKRLLSQGFVGRPKGFGKMSSINAALASSYQKKNQRFAEFGRKRGPKTKMRGIFGVPGVGLQRPQGDSSSSKTDDEPGGENRLVLCSAKDKYVLTQDVCVMCGALGQDQEGCLIACAQCGQCYHPYCVSVKVTKVVLQKGWRCLDCTVCEGCGQRHDEARLILCDDCDISYHTYCMDPPLNYVPRGVWKCKWCAQCQTCGSQDPGFNCSWLKNYSECGPCASRTTCPVCSDAYSEADLIIKCIQCERWLHCSCDKIRNEADAEICAEEGYNCLLCRPRDVPPPHLSPAVTQARSAAARPTTPEVAISCLMESCKQEQAETTAPPPPPPPPAQVQQQQTGGRISSAGNFMVDGVCLSEAGMNQIKALTMEHAPRKKRGAHGARKLEKELEREMALQKQEADEREAESQKQNALQMEAGILATIESVVAGDCEDEIEEDSLFKEDFYKDGMQVPPMEDGKPPEPPKGFTIFIQENGVMILRKKRVRNLQKLGIGGFNSKLRNTRKEKDEDPAADGSVTPGGSDNGATPQQGNTTPGSDEKPRKKPQRRKIKSKLVESYPSYLQEAFFGRDLLDTTKEAQDLNSSSEESDDGRVSVSDDKTITLSQEELKAIEEMKIKQEKEQEVKKQEQAVKTVVKKAMSVKTEEEEEEPCDAETLTDILKISDNLLGSDLVKTIMNEGCADIKNEEQLVDSTVGNNSTESSSASTVNCNQSHKDELSDILGPNFNLESMVRETGLPNMDSKDVEEIFKGVLTDDSQPSQEVAPAVFSNGASHPPPTAGAHSASNVGVQPSSHPVLQSPVPVQRQQSLPSVVTNSPIGYPSASPYHSEYSNSPQFSPVFSEPPSPWADDGSGDGTASQRNTAKMEAEEALGSGATISAVLYANMNHPEWRTEYPVWSERCKQIIKKWRTLPLEKRSPYVQQARENRTNMRLKKPQDPEKNPHGKSNREAEQERQWKQLQAFRQQQQQAMQDQRAVISRMRGTPGVQEGQFQTEAQSPTHIATQLQVSASQEPPVNLPSMTSPSGVAGGGGGIRTIQQQQQFVPQVQQVVPGGLKIARVLSPAQYHQPQQQRPVTPFSMPPRPRPPTPAPGAAPGAPQPP
ncbi:hypothetical protein LSTR_LSTR003201, partial [Laodelphax striatellus]